MTRKPWSLLSGHGRLLRATALAVALVFVGGVWWTLPPGPRQTWKVDPRPLDLVLSVDGRAVGVAHPHGLSVWDVATGTRRAALHLPSEPNVIERGVAIEFLSADGRVVVFRDDGGTRQRLWDSAANQEPVELGFRTVVKASADGNTLVIKGFPGWPMRDAELQTWELTTGRTRVVLSDRAADIGDIVPLRDGRFVAVGSKPRAIWDLTTEKQLLSLPDGNYFCRFARAGCRVACGTGSDFQVWDLTTGKQVSAGTGGNAADEPLALSPDGGRLVMYRRCVFTLWDVTPPAAQLLGVITATGGVLQEFSPDGTWFAAGMPSDFGEKFDLYRTVPFGKAMHISWADFGPRFAANHQTFVAERPGHGGGWRDWWPGQSATGHDLDVVDLATQRRIATLGPCDAWTYTADGTAIIMARDPDTIEVWDIPPRRHWLIDRGLPVVAGILLVLLARQFGKRRHVADSATPPDATTPGSSPVAE